MKKIVRLTESDLIRLVKKVINEQPTTRRISGTQMDYSGFVKLQKPIRIKATLKIPMMLDITHKKVDAFGCEFIGVMRGSSETFSFKFNFNCEKQNLIVVTSPMGDFKKGDVAVISSEAIDSLIDACGCDSYVKNDSRTGNRV